MKRFSSVLIVGAVLAWMGLATASPPGDAATLRNSPDDEGIKAEEILRQAGLSLDGASLRAAARDERQADEIRYWAAIALGRQGGAGAAEVLAATLESSNADLRLGAVQGFGELGGGKAVRNLKLALRDSEAGVRGAAVLALGKIGGRSAVAQLGLKLRDGDELEAAVRMQAAVELGRLGDPSAKPALLQSLADPAAVVRGAAAVALATFGDPRATPALVGVALDPLSEEWIRVDAIRALERLSGESFQYVKAFHAPTTAKEREAALQHIRQWWQKEQRPGGRL